MKTLLPQPRAADGIINFHSPRESVLTRCWRWLTAKSRQTPTVRIHVLSDPVAVPPRRTGERRIMLHGRLIRIRP